MKDQGASKPALFHMRARNRPAPHTLFACDRGPRLRELAQRRLFLPRGAVLPDALAKVCSAHVDTKTIEAHWDSLVHLAASVMSGQASAVTVMARLGSAARGDMLYDAGVQLGKLLRTAFLTDYFVNEGFRRELRRVLNRGEAVIPLLGAHCRPNRNRCWIRYLRIAPASFAAS